jgi:hypothetical protein
MSLGDQVESLHNIYLSWYAETQALAEQVISQLANFSKVLAARAPRGCLRFEHVAAIAGELSNAPSHAWVAFVDVHELWNPRCAQLLLPSLRKAAVDQRILAACCRSRASTATSSKAPSSAAEVEAADMELVVGDATHDPDIADYVVKVKTLLSFIETTPPGMLSHELCTHRLLYKLGHTFGKKVHAIALPDTDAPWLRWVERLCPRGSQPHGVASFAEEVSPNDDDRQRGQEICDNLKGLERFADVEAASLLMARFRFGVLRRMAQLAGEKVMAKELKKMATEQTTAFLSENDLSEVYGMQRWIRDVATEVAEASAQEFSVTVTSE